MPKFIAVLKETQYPVVEIEADTLEDAAETLAKEGSTSCDARVLHQFEYPEGEILSIRSANHQEA